MYCMFSNDFMNQWNHPNDVEKKRKEEAEKKQKRILMMNIENLENCIKKHSIDNLDRTKPFDKTFICDNFIHSSGYAYIYDHDGNASEIKNLTEKFTPVVKKLDITHVDTPKNIVINKGEYDKFYKFPSNIIPKNTFTDIGSFLIFRISNTTEESTKNINEITHHTVITRPPEDE